MSDTNSFSKMTVTQLKTHLKANNISFKSSDKKADLIALATPKTSKKPTYLIINATSPDRRAFHFKDNSKEPGELLGGYLEILPVSSFLCKKGYVMFADDSGMMKQLSMNTCVNPFMDDKVLCYHAMTGGPFGNVVLCLEGGNLDVELLLGLCKKQDKIDEEEYWEDQMNQALKEWESS